MGGLAHYFERAGLATTQISLVRLHTEKMRPPRALWVPFELGRPFGPPDEPDFQRRVVVAALALLEADAGPVLRDYPEEAPDGNGETEGWACPVSFSRPAEKLTGAAALQAAMTAEIERLQTWYDRALAARGRTTVGASSLALDEAAALLAALAAGETPPSPLAGVPLADAARLAAEDLKAFYLEAAAAQPGSASSAELGAWFWRETAASDVLRQAGEQMAASEDETVRITGQVLMVPRAHA